MILLAPLVHIRGHVLFFERLFLVTKNNSPHEWTCKCYVLVNIWEMQALLYLYHIFKHDILKYQQCTCTPS